VLAALPQERWQTITWREQDDVVLRKQFVAVRAHWATGGAQCSTSHHRVATGPEGWLLGERPGPGSAARSNGTSATSRRTRPCNDWWNWRIAAGPLSNCMRMPKGGAAWTITRADAGMGCIAILPWSCWPLAFSRASAGCPPTWRAFPPLGGAPVVAVGPPPGARMALPGCRVMAHRHQPDCPVPSQTDLTK